jgi:aryl-alcohol dehydrogenase-like predicted oxidoreductase
VKQRTLGRTGLTVSALALGTVELGIEYGIALPGESGRPSQDEANRLVHAAIDGGINLIDTARAYGESESVLGIALQGRRDKVVLATKVGTELPDRSVPQGDDLRKLMETSLDTSLRNLQTDYVDIWQIHNVTQPLLDQVDILAEVFDKARQAGKIRSTGGSTYGTEMPLKSIEANVFDMLQVTYSVLDQRLVDEVFPAAKAANIGIIVRSILLKGVLTSRGDYLPDNLAVLRDRSREFRRLISEARLNASAVQAAIAFGLGNEYIDSVLVGLRSLEELHEALGAADLELSKELWSAMAALRLDDEDLLNPSTWGF